MARLFDLIIIVKLKIFPVSRIHRSSDFITYITGNNKNLSIVNSVIMIFLSLGFRNVSIISNTANLRYCLCFRAFKICL